MKFIYDGTWEYRFIRNYPEGINTISSFAVD